MKDSLIGPRRRRRAVFLAFVLIVAGCHKRKPVPALAPAILTSMPATHTPTRLPGPPIPPTDPPAIVVPEVNLLEQADLAFDAGNYVEAGKGYEDYLQMHPSGDQRDQALFRLALTCALRPNATPDWNRITALLKQLIDHYPESPLRAQSLVILALQSELSQVSSESQKRDQRIKQLTTEIDKLKQIDADRRKRP